MKKTPSLAYFCEAYLHQDFAELFGDAEGALRAYRETESAEEQGSLRAEVTSLLASADEEQLRRLLGKICAYDYLSDFASAREWLRHLSASNFPLEER